MRPKRTWVPGEIQPDPDQPNRFKFVYIEKMGDHLKYHWSFQNFSKAREAKTTMRCLIEYLNVLERRKGEEG